MMEVKHSTPMEFNDMVSASSSAINNSIGSPLSDTGIDRNQLEDGIENVAEPNLKTLHLQNSESLTNGTGSSSMISSEIMMPSIATAQGDDLEDVELDLATSITPELEDKLLADDDADAEDHVVNKLLAEVAPVAIIENIVELGNAEKLSTNSATLLRDPGDDLDTLLSKINDIVEDSNDAVTAVETNNEIVENKAIGETESLGISAVAEEKSAVAEENSAVVEEKSANSSVVLLEDSVNDKTEITDNFYDALTSSSENDFNDEQDEFEAAAAADNVEKQMALDDAQKGTDAEAVPQAVVTMGLQGKMLKELSEEPMEGLQEGSNEKKQEGSREDLQQEPEKMSHEETKTELIKELPKELIEEASFEESMEESIKEANEKPTEETIQQPTEETAENQLQEPAESLWKHSQVGITQSDQIILDVDLDSITEEKSIIGTQEQVEPTLTSECANSQEIVTNTNQIEAKDDDAEEFIPETEEEVENEKKENVLENAQKENVAEVVEKANIVENEESAMLVENEKKTNVVDNAEKANVDNEEKSSVIENKNIDEVVDNKVFPLDEHKVEVNLSEIQPTSNDVDNESAAKVVEKEEIKKDSAETVETELNPPTEAAVETGVSTEVLGDKHIPEVRSSQEQTADNTHNETDTAKEKSTKTLAINLDADDSDDDIVFYVEKPKVAVDEAKEIDKKLVSEEKVSEINTPAKPQIVDDDDVVLLDDDEDEEDLISTAKFPPKEQSPEKMEVDGDESKPTPIKEGISKFEDGQKRDESVDKNFKIKEDSKESITQMCDDNSDNARDEFAAEKCEKDSEEQSQKKEQKPSADMEETNSNCSSSSNLLQEAKPASSEGGEEETDINNDDDDDTAADNDCEIVADELDIVEADVADEVSKDGTCEEKELPPAKRMRMSVDDDESSKMSLEKPGVEEVKQEVVSEEATIDLQQTLNAEDSKEIAIDAGKITNKRSHDETLDKDEDAKDIDNKKLKTDKTAEEKPTLNAANLEKQQPDVGHEDADSKGDVIEIKDVMEDEIVKSAAVEEQTIEGEASMLPRLKGVPSHVPVPLYPPPNFEATAPELGFDFLKRFKKTLDRMTKIDLEELVLQKIVEAIIHKSEFGEMRELIEKQEKLISTHRMKITELSKQFRDLEMVHNRVLKDIETKNSQFLMPVKITRAVGLQVFIPLKKNADPVGNAAANSMSPISAQNAPQNRGSATATSALPPPLTSPLRQSSNPNDASNASFSLNARNNLMASAGATAVVNSRRGCMQKITPQRPIDSSTNTSQASAAAATYRNASQQPASQQIPAKLLNKTVSPTAQIRARYGSNVQNQQQQQQITVGRQQNIPTNQTRKVVTTPSKLPTVPNLPNTTSIIGQQYRRAESTSQTSTSPATVPENYMSSIHQVPAGLPSVSITPAKPKDKSVIDLTDEDDAPSSTTPTPPTLTPLATRQKTPVSSSNTAHFQLNKLTGTQIRVPSTSINNQSKVHAARQQLSSMNMYGAPKSNGNSPVPTNISTPAGTSITRIQINAATQRSKFGHPAPLPPTPTQNMNPAWKLPPPRPTIRISNLDNGIVISWTVEESMDRHADCVSYQIYAYQETSGPPLIDSWRHVGDVKAMLLPMAVTLTQFQEGQRYFFAVRAVDVHHRVGPFSVPKTWS